MYAKLSCTPNSILNGSDHAEYTRKSWLIEDKSKHHGKRKVCPDRNKLRIGKEWRPNAQ